jgi:hypothetical protein
VEVFFPASRGLDQEKTLATNRVLLKGKLVPVYVSFSAIPERPLVRFTPTYLTHQGYIIGCHSPSPILNDGRVEKDGLLTRRVGSDDDVFSRIGVFTFGTGNPTPGPGPGPRSKGITSQTRRR